MSDIWRDEWMKNLASSVGYYILYYQIAFIHEKKVDSFKIWQI
jgi:hypothetical protein